MSWSDGFFDYYVSKRRMFVLIWAAVSAVIVLFLTIHLLPFTYASVASHGVVTAHDCRGKARIYTFRYEVDGQVYTGTTAMADWDGNGPCWKLEPGVEVPITYRIDDPSRSIGGTIGSWSKIAFYHLLIVAMLCFLVLPFPLYIKEQRSN